MKKQISKENKKYKKALKPVTVEPVSGVRAGAGDWGPDEGSADSENKLSLEPVLRLRRPFWSL